MAGERTYSLEDMFNRKENITRARKNFQKIKRTNVHILLTTMPFFCYNEVQKRMKGGEYGGRTDVFLC